MKKNFVSKYLYTMTISSIELPRRLPETEKTELGSTQEKGEPMKKKLVTLLTERKLQLSTNGVSSNTGAELDSLGRREVLLFFLLALPPLFPSSHSTPRQ